MKMPGERSVAKLSNQSVKMLLNLIIEMDWPEADEMDRWTATELATAAISTLTLHEYCHALAGHLDLLSSKAEKTLALNEVPLPLKNADEALTRRALEWDADCFGAVQSWNAMLKTRDIAKAVAIQKARGIFDETEYRAMRLSFFSISTYVLFRYFDSHGSHTDETHASHPAPAKRQWCSINTIGVDLTKRGVISQKQFNDTLVPIVVAVETALRRGRRSAFTTSPGPAPGRQRPRQQPADGKQCRTQSQAASADGPGGDRRPIPERSDPQDPAADPPRLSAFQCATARL